VEKTHAEVEVDGRLFVLVLDRDQLLHRETGDLITAEIEAVHPPSDKPSE
jgi:hypothetical protein